MLNSTVNINVKIIFKYSLSLNVIYKKSFKINFYLIILIKKSLQNVVIFYGKIQGCD